MGDVPVEKPDSGLKVKSIFCFLVAPDMRRKGITKRLLERAIQDAERDGFDAVEAYPKKAFQNDAVDFMGPVGLYLQNGFTVVAETGDKLVLSRRLIPSS